MEKIKKIGYILTAIILSLTLSIVVIRSSSMISNNTSKVEILEKKHGDSNYAFKKELIAVSYQDYTVLFYLTMQDRIAAALFSRHDDKEIYLNSSGVLAINDDQLDSDFPVIAKGLNTVKKSFIWGCANDGDIDKVFVDNDSAVIISSDGFIFWFIMLDANDNDEKTVYFFKNNCLIDEVVI